MSQLTQLTYDRIQYFNTEYDKVYESMRHITDWDERHKVLGPWEAKQHQMYIDALHLHLLDYGFTTTDIKELKETYTTNYGMMCCLFIDIYMMTIPRPYQPPHIPTEKHRKEFDDLLSASLDFFQTIHKAKKDWYKASGGK